MCRAVFVQKAARVYRARMRARDYNIIKVPEVCRGVQKINLFPFCQFSIPFTFGSVCSLYRSFGAWPEIAKLEFNFSGPMLGHQSEAIRFRFTATRNGGVAGGGGGGGAPPPPPPAALKTGAPKCGEGAKMTAEVCMVLKVKLAWNTLFK